MAWVCNFHVPSSVTDAFNKICTDLVSAGWVLEDTVSATILYEKYHRVCFIKERCQPYGLV